jgi:hypothetical protein
MTTANSIFFLSDRVPRSRVVAILSSARGGCAHADGSRKREGTACLVDEGAFLGQDHSRSFVASAAHLRPWYVSVHESSYT